MTIHNEIAFQECVDLERSAAYHAATDRLIAPLGAGQWRLAGTEDVLNEDGVRELVRRSPGWTFTASLGVLLYGPGCGRMLISSRKGWRPGGGGNDQAAVDDAFGVPEEAWERDHAVLKAWLARRSGRAVDDDPSLTDEQRAQIQRAIARERKDQEGGDDEA